MLDDLVARRPPAGGPGRRRRRSTGAREDRHAAGVGARRADRAGDRPRAPALEQLGQVGRHLAPDQHQQPVAGLQARRAARQQRLVAAHDQRDERVARQPEIAQRATPSAASPGRITCSTTSRARARAPRRPRAPRLRRAGSSVVTPSRRATGSIVVPCSTVDSRTAKNTMLKNSRRVGHALDDREDRQHDGHRAAQPGPAEHRLLAPRRSRCRAWTPPWPAAARRRRPRAPSSVPFQRDARRAGSGTRAGRA